MGCRALDGPPVADVSQYAWIHGIISLDTSAADHFKTSKSWSGWCAVPPVPPVESHPIGIVESDFGLTLDFGGGDYRNLCRYLAVDLARAAQIGKVTGLLTTDCNDGCHDRQVICYTDLGVWMGTGECFHRPVVAGPAFFLELGDTGFTILIGRNELAAERGSQVMPFPGLLTPVAVPNSLVLTGADAPYDCACGGYNEEDVPVCLNETAVL
jgi:hypothetical protein